MSTPERIPVSVLTGILGSGKSTLLNRMLRSSRWSDTAVIVNEHGEIALDHELIETSEDNDIRSGKLRALATTGVKRSPTLPDLPTIAESGVSGYESTAWFGLAVPVGTPKDIVARLNAEGQKATKSPEFVKRMTDLGYEIVGGTPEQMASMILDEYKRWGPIVTASGAKVD